MPLCDLTNLSSEGGYLVPSSPLLSAQAGALGKRAWDALSSPSKGSSQGAREHNMLPTLGK